MNDVAYSSAMGGADPVRFEERHHGGRGACLGKHVDDDVDDGDENADNIAADHRAAAGTGPSFAHIDSLRMAHHTA